MVKNKKNIVILLSISLATLIGIFLIDYFCKEPTLVFRILETLLTIISSVLSTLGLTINYKKQENKNTFQSANNNTNIQMSGSGFLIIDNSKKNDVSELAKKYKEMGKFKKDNINLIVEKAGKIAHDENITILCSPKKDFILKYLSEGALISSNDLQEIWAYLLVHECQNPGTISKRTLDVVKNMNSAEAKLFSDVTVHCLDDGALYKVLCDDRTEINFLNLTILQDIGLIKSVEFISRHIKIDTKGEESIINSGYIFLIKNIGDTPQEIDFDCYILTSVGLEVKNALGVHMTQEIFLQLCKKSKISILQIKIFSFPCTKLYAKRGLKLIIKTKIFYSIFRKSKTSNAVICTQKEESFHRF